VLLRPYYREYDLPWTISEEDQERFRKILLATLILALLLGILFPLLPKPQRVDNQAEQLPPRLAKLMIEQTKPPPPPPPPKEEPKPEPKPDKPQPKPVDRQKQARDKAAVAGLLPFKDELADLRDNSMVDLATAKRPLTDAARAGDVAERSLITSKVGRGSGGINTSNLSRGFGGGGGGSLAGRATTQVRSSLEGDAGRDTRSGAGGKAARSREEIELIFDRNKGAIYALYNRALRSNPALQGKVVLELTIAPSGEVTQCRIVSSELGDEELERKLIARVKLFRFEAKEVEAITTTKPIDFFPA
jgi:periplasmic protein TonB